MNHKINKKISFQTHKQLKRFICLPIQTISTHHLYSWQGEGEGMKREKLKKEKILLFC